MGWWLAIAATVAVIGCTSTSPTAPPIVPRLTNPPTMTAAASLVATPIAAPSASASASPAQASPGPTTSTQGLAAQAERALDQWTQFVQGTADDTIVLPQQKATEIDNGSVPGAGDTARNAVLAGLIEADFDISGDVPEPAQVTWSDGATSSVVLVSAAAALRAATTDYYNPTVRCPRCNAVHIVDVTLVQGRYNTTSGPANIPTWQFTLREGGVHVFRIAAAHALFPADQPMSIAQVDGDAASPNLAVGFMIGFCDDKSTYGLAAAESDLAVAVYSMPLVLPPPTENPSPACSDASVDTETVQLAAPLGARTVIDQNANPIALNWQLTSIGGDEGRPTGQ